MGRCDGAPHVPIDISWVCCLGDLLRLAMCSSPLPGILKRMTPARLQGSIAAPIKVAGLPARPVLAIAAGYQHSLAVVTCGASRPAVW